MMQNIVRLLLFTPSSTMFRLCRPIFSCGARQLVSWMGGPASTPTPQLGDPPSVSAQSRSDRGVKLAGNDAPLLHEGASPHEAHGPQSTGQVSQFSSLPHRPSP